MFNLAGDPMIIVTKPEGENTKELILRTALELFRGCGCEITTMRDIARAAKVATGAAYYYFPRIYDESPDQQKTHKLVDGVLRLLAQAIEWTSSAFVRPVIQPFQEKVLHMLQDAG